MIQYKKPEITVSLVEEDIVTTSLGSLTNGDGNSNTLPLLPTFTEEQMNN